MSDTNNINQLTPTEKENALREIRKLVDILTSWGNVLVPSLEGKETTARERLIHFIEKLKADGMSEEDIDREISKLK